ncbi:MAG: 2-amino-4-hydroxy-6-hydroxymethyldihydropteridine diphosphokinase [Gammaproteobacteria bacterium]|nr:2-amino-4-hydroxy-6-hydroxymethyldihydropteridine diphosphokinase [Gammaproteobacteria bacterium]
MGQAIDFSEYAFVAIGSNLPSSVGDSLQTINFAINELEKLGSSPLLKSSIYSTSPIDSPPGTPDFLNALVGLLPSAHESPHSLLQKLQAIESQAGRNRSGIKNEARTLDLDLILYKKELISDPDLALPHPRLQDRKFVMQPLVELVGREFKFPETECTAGEILDCIQDQKSEKIDS